MSIDYGDEFENNNNNNNNNNNDDDDNNDDNEEDEFPEILNGNDQEIRNENLSERPGMTSLVLL